MNANQYIFVGWVAVMGILVCAGCVLFNLREDEQRRTAPFSQEIIDREMKEKFIDFTIKPGDHAEFWLYKNSGSVSVKCSTVAR